ncbi:MAG TPA: 1-acyl-sn-glycerol-3-phosphate acyltransferase [Mollicutes bacterium]|nr:1-acyl-sn-glycerol-3-phosphate acyltransferase [Mollicutes bacterium]
MDAIKKIARNGMRLLFRVEVINEHKVPKEGGAILCSNHISAFDGPLIVAFANRKINIVAKKELWNNKLISYFLNKYNAIQVDREKPSIASLREMKKVLCNGEVLALFPEGTRNGLAKEVEVKGGASFLSTITQKPIVPIKIVGKYRLFHKIKLIYGNPFVVKNKQEGIKEITDAIEMIKEPCKVKVYKQKNC